MRAEAIKEQMGYLQEQLERLEAGLSSSVEFLATKQNLIEAQKTTRELEQTIDQELYDNKLLTSQLLLTKLTRLVVQEGQKEGVNLAFGGRAEGKLSVATVEIIMPAIMAMIRSTLFSIKMLAVTARLKKGLFATPSVFIEVLANEDFIEIKIIDDGMGLQTKRLVPQELEKNINEIRAIVAAQDGLCTFQSGNEYGGEISFRMPVKRARNSAYVLAQGPFQFAVPASCVLAKNDFQKISGGKVKDEKCYIVDGDQSYQLFAFDPKLGLVALENLPINEGVGSFVCCVGVADRKIAILSSAEPRKVTLRLYPTTEYLVDEAWFCSIGLFVENSKPNLISYLRGEELLKFVLVGKE